MRLERTPDDGNFGNGEWPSGKPPEWPWPEKSPKVLLRRLEYLKHRRFLRAKEVEEFELRLPITYVDNSRGPDQVRVITVPDSEHPFTTDLTSVPQLLTWLVPKSGRHLPAALIHDGLIGEDPPSYLTDDGSTIDRIDADVIFRNAMHDTGVELARRWLVWAAVANASLLSGARPGWRFEKWWYRIVGALVLLFIGWCGLSATVEVLDASSLPRGLGWVMALDLPFTSGSMAMGDLPWIDETSWWVEVAQGLAGAILIPLALALLWGRYYRAGAIAGLALATLFHAMVAVAFVAAFYMIAELIAKVPWAALLLSFAAVAGSLVLFLNATSLL
jgi:hypothetical protein